MVTITRDITCPHCGAEISVDTDIDPMDEALMPRTRAKLIPDSLIPRYVITTSDMGVFIGEKAESYKRGSKIEVVPRYVERDLKKKGIPNPSYAYLRISYSENILAGSDNQSFFHKLGESDTAPMIVPTIYEHMIKRYAFSGLEETLKDYAQLDAARKKLGVDDAFIKDIMEFAIPRPIRSKVDGKLWIVTSADPLKVIEDMLVNPSTGKLDGKPLVTKIEKLSESNNIPLVSYTVMMLPQDMDEESTRYVRAIMTGAMKRR